MGSFHHDGSLASTEHRPGRSPQPSGPGAASWTHRHASHCPRMASAARRRIFASALPCPHHAGRLPFRVARPLHRRSDPCQRPPLRSRARHPALSASRATRTESATRKTQPPVLHRERHRPERGGEGGHVQHGRLQRQRPGDRRPQPAVVERADEGGDLVGTNAQRIDELVEDEHVERERAGRSARRRRRRSGRRAGPHRAAAACRRPSRPTPP